MFAKVFESMYDGSLATSGPWEALVTFQQLLVLADRFGDVDMTAEVISRRTIIPLEIIRKGIEELEKPDQQSRDPSHEGRRIVPISPTRAWGWHIVNYSKYAAIRSAEERREYKAAYYREKVAPTLKATKPSDEFNAFYTAYPKKVAKQAAAKAWNKLDPTPEQQAQILSAIVQQKASDQWRKDGGKFIPNPASWLNGRRWEDDVSTPAIDLGRCHYCERPAVKRTNDIPHCDTPRHLDFANTRQR